MYFQDLQRFKVKLLRCRLMEDRSGELRYANLVSECADLVRFVTFGRELRYIGRWERKKMSEHGGSALLGVPFRSQIAVSVGQNVRSFLGTLSFR